MDLTRLRVSGFKSFVDPTDLVIEDGLTGVVGPNGCGKSNLVEALRWVMGESSYKNLRGSGMDDVIFSGSGNRPSRNVAEVVLSIDNQNRSAPAAFNSDDTLDVSRKIERDSGSTYRVNGKEVRARDVQLLFADAATGARSSALVRQGQIGELISAKPQARRRVIEDAAGIAGLHSRRHEAELRLKAAETNLERLGDHIGLMAGQLESLKKQARQAARFKDVSSRIREAEAIGFHLRWLDATTALTEHRTALDEAMKALAARTTTLSQANRANAVAASELPDLRKTESEAAAKLTALRSARDALKAEEQRIASRRNDLEHQLEQIALDLNRENGVDADILPRLEQLDAEAKDLQAASGNREQELGAARAAKAEKAEALKVVEDQLATLLSEAAETRASLAQLDRTIADADERETKILGQHRAAADELRALQEGENGEGGTAFLLAAESMAKEAQAAAENALSAKQDALDVAIASEAGAREALEKSERAAATLTTEARTLEGILRTSADGIAAPVLDGIVAETGYEVALGSALGDDLDYSTDPADPIHWSQTEAMDDPVLPEGAQPLAERVRAPEALTRRLRQIGVIAEEDGPRLAGLLEPGQRLVSRTGALWRWDGLTARADAPTAAAQRLAQSNRLDTLRAQIEKATKDISPLKATHDGSQATIATIRTALQAARTAMSESRATLEKATRAVRDAERENSRKSARAAALTDALGRLDESLAECRAAKSTAETTRCDAPSMETHDTALRACRKTVEMARTALAQAHSHAEGLEGEARQKQNRLAAIEEEKAAWQKRIESASAQRARLSERQSIAESELTELAEKPGVLVEKHRDLSIRADEAEAARKTAADKLSETENRQRELDAAERSAQAMLAEARELKASAEVRLEAITTKRDELAHQIDDALGVQPHAIIASIGRATTANLPSLDQIDSTLERLRRDRERLGGVNLRAEEEAAEVQAQHDGMVAEREDVETAIRKLRGAIGNLNREGRERLMAAFDTVNSHFQTLFTLLFGGGTAELQLIESDDPLEAGLEIVARPPGKKPQTLTLLSGGEQALTAIALIFAVFLTNPSPICVLDEVDAPLDDANVERYCDLLEKMAQSTQTRFLVITHNPITMARMNRLFGVTMAERGVSQLVSVDLETAERYREAG